ncbi:hypothetical protein KC723_00045 [Candidatus Kaiserbacteria bacterium]|nr:hypothetical protein [Candidatus Kaiserbacteria bacterium]
MIPEENKDYNSVYKTSDKIQTEIKEELNKNDTSEFLVFFIIFLILPTIPLYVLFIDNSLLVIIIASVTFPLLIVFVVKQIKQIRIKSNSSKLLMLNNELANILLEKEKIDLENENKNVEQTHLQSTYSYGSRARNSWDLVQLSKFLIAVVLTISVFVSWGPLAGILVGFILFMII